MSTITELPELALRPEVKADLVAALRSGDYTQGRYTMRRREVQKRFIRKDIVTECFCVQGVLTDLAVKAGVLSWEVDKQGKFILRDPRGGTHSVTGITTPVLMWATEKGKHDMPVSTGLYELWEYNDKYQVTFDEFADLIEAQ